MASHNSLVFLEGRSVSKTVMLVLESCLGGGDQDGGKAISEFFTRMKIHQEAFFRDISGDWDGRPFLGEHAYKIVRAAGYEGTEHDLWIAVTGFEAPYALKAPKVSALDKAAAVAATKAARTKVLAIGRVKGARSSGAKKAMAKP